ncbi:hypothetical protein QQY79_06735 [Flavobacterium tructae]|uniref:hypothetical protein n=1 Tax=Flavobacterium tructae TaxID=1114873 RepID=UPI002551F88F|nr:hypothetical protein [Flavobacterium tructae]MDL2142212.1 hypothetical protein [Flavobacterium tructae]
MKKLILLVLLIIFSHNIFAQNAIPFGYVNKFYNEISFDEYDNNKTKMSDFGNSIKLDLTNIKQTDSVNIKSKITFLSKNKKYLAIKFNEINSPGSVKILCLENNSQIDLPYPYSSILKLQGKFLLEFYSTENNPKYPEINKLKSIVKDSKGALNIYKLAEVIEQNKASLSKYLDQ